MPVRKFVLTTKDDIKKLIEAWPKCTSNREVAEMVGKDEAWVSRIVPAVRAVGYDLPKKYVREKLEDTIRQALIEMTPSK